MVIIMPAISAPTPPRPTIGHTLAVLGSVRAGAEPDEPAGAAAAPEDAEEAVDAAAAGLALEAPAGGDDNAAST